MVGGMGIRGVWLAIALTDAVLVVITVFMMLSEFRKMPGTNGIRQYEEELKMYLCRWQKQETQYIVKDIGLPTGIWKNVWKLLE